MSKKCTWVDLVTLQIQISLENVRLGGKVLLQPSEHFSSNKIHLSTLLNWFILGTDVSSIMLC